MRKHILENNSFILSSRSLLNQVVSDTLWIPLVLYKVTYDAWERQPEWLLGQHWNQTVLPAIVVCFGVGGSCNKHVDVARLHWYSGSFMFFFLTNMFFCMNMLSGYIRYPMYTMHSSTSHHITWFICIELSSCTLFFVHVLVLGAYLPSIFNCFEVYCISLSNCAPLLRSWCQSDPSEPRWREPICIWSSRTLHFSHGF